MKAEEVPLGINTVSFLCFRADLAQRRRRVLWKSCPLHSHGLEAQSKCPLCPGAPRVPDLSGPSSRGGWRIVGQWRGARGDLAQTHPKSVHFWSNSSQGRISQKKKVLWDVVHFFLKQLQSYLVHIYLFSVRKVAGVTLWYPKRRSTQYPSVHTHTETLYSHNCSAYWSRGQSLMAQKQSILGMLWLVQCMYSINVSLY